MASPPGVAFTGETEEAAGAVPGSGEAGDAPGSNVQLIRAGSPNAKHKFKRLRLLLGVGEGGAKSRAALRSRPMPSEVDSLIPGISDAWVAFQALDHANQECLDWEDGALLANNMCKPRKKFTAQSFRAEIENVTSLKRDSDRFGFVLFSKFLERYQVFQRREVRRQVKDIFDLCDKDRSGILDKAEFALVIEKAKKYMGEGPTGVRNLDLELEWASLRKVPLLGTHQNMMLDGDSFTPEQEAMRQEEGVTFKSFERWWKDKAGIVEPDIPVLPEFMSLAGQQYTRPQMYWRSLGARLRTLVDMKRHWGHLHEMYETSAESSYENVPLGKWTRDPDSDFSAAWDLSSVLMLLYVSVTVPLRAGFQLDVDLWSASFWVDVIVDVFFVLDMFLNFRTAYYDRAGLREDRAGRMARNYLSGWYLGYFMKSGGENSANFRAIKAFRLIRLGKMLRLARIKRILAKYGNDVNMQQYINIGFTIFLILFLIHMLSCFFFMVGLEHELLPSGEIVSGWVNGQAGWCVEKPEQKDKYFGASWRLDDPACGNTTASAPLLVLYLGSMQKVLNPLENVETSLERGFSVFAELVRDLILGLIAGLLAAIQISMSANDAEVDAKLRGLKRWMTEKKLPKTFQAKTMQFFNEMWSNRLIDQTELFKEMPPTMASTVSEFLYKRFLSSIPLFRSLSTEVISSLCHHMQPLTALKGQVIMEEGQLGKEMYLVMAGEVEVLCHKNRLGFLSDGAFFGEVAVLETRSGSEIRTRSVRSVTDSTELCFITKESMEVLQQMYPELRARIRRFVRTGQTRGKKLTKKSLAQVGLTRSEMEEYTATFEEVKEATRYVRKQEEKAMLPQDNVRDESAASPRPWEQPKPTEHPEFIPWKRVVTGIRLLRKAKAAKSRIAMRRSNSASLAPGATPRTPAQGKNLLGEEPASPTPPSSASNTGRKKALAIQVPGEDNLHLELPTSIPASAPAGLQHNQISKPAQQIGMDWDVVKKPATPAANQVLTTVAVNTRAELAEVHMAINRMDDRNAREVAQLRRTVTAQADQLAAVSLKLDTLLEALLPAGGVAGGLRMP